MTKIENINYITIVILSAIVVGCSPRLAESTSQQIDGNNIELKLGQHQDSTATTRLNLLERPIIFRNSKKLLKAVGKYSTGTATINFTIDNKGKVTFAEIDPPSTFKSQKVLKNILAAFMDFRFTPDPLAPSEQCGKYVFSLDTNNSTE